MKTKSKRFSNLATLCLALLGTTLLMARPVKAEGPERDRVEDQERENPYQKGLRDGNKAGYEQGKQDRQQKQNVSPDASPTPPDRDKVEVPEPGNNPYDKDDDKQRYKNGWNIAYLSSYFNGWYSAERTDYPENTDDQSEERESDDSSQDDGRHQGSVDSSSQQEDTDIISPVVETVLQAVLGVLSSFLSWLEKAI
ncbi:hypothetical protein [Streptococcus pyogenes]|uniref:hypothetical protein n=1 Tax=Streptococcus pyogenes TaxID=1314 RepID=UPI00109D0CA7|nr:hypothetical protein [Streptococcus pyogenes]VGU84682.1 Uncharacterised protein [Streptococcus pyogenes]VGV07261.1 Uncharacterised protein [Streptococcus pyogenes]VGV95293.1 Uncharacterised protein [Streptococcus pyogenes]VGW18200.1 Uncharacterised protein [Streptococcus pyogenes]VGW20075.1 Uncharacterised protein [Streptococcus pyogenes]